MPRASLHVPLRCLKTPHTLVAAALRKPGERTGNLVLPRICSLRSRAGQVSAGTYSQPGGQLAGAWWGGCTHAEESALGNGTLGRAHSPGADGPAGLGPFTHSSGSHRCASAGAAHPPGSQVTTPGAPHLWQVATCSPVTHPLDTLTQLSCWFPAIAANRSHLGNGFGDAARRGARWRTGSLMAPGTQLPHLRWDPRELCHGEQP